MPNKINKHIFSIKQIGAKLIKIADEAEQQIQRSQGLQSICDLLSWDDLQHKLFPDAADKFCPRMFLAIDQWKCTCECSKCRKQHVPMSVLQTLSDFHSLNPFS